MNKKSKNIVIGIVLFAFAIVSFTGLSKHFSDVDTYTKQIQILDEKKENALELTAASTALSIGITVIPGDVGEPVADKLADLSGYLMFIVAALFTEKCLLTLTGTLAFKFIIPIGLALLGIYLIVTGEPAKNSFTVMVSKIMLVSIAIWAIIPFSLMVTESIDKTIDKSVEIQIEQANEYSEQLQMSDGEDETSFLNKLKSKIGNGIKGVEAKLHANLNGFIEVIAGMIVTTCVIPLGTFALMLWIIKMLMGADIQFRLPKASKLRKKLTDTDYENID